MAILRPDGDISVSLIPNSGTSHFALINESTLDTTYYVYAASNGAGTPGSGTDICSCGTFTRPDTIKSVTGWFYIGLYPGANGGTATATIKIYKGSTELASVSASTGWNSITYTGDLTQSEIDDLQVYVYLSCVDGSTTDGKTYTYYQSTAACYMAYIEVIPNQTVTPGSISSSIALGTAKLTLCLLPASITSSAVFGTIDVSQGKSIAPSGIAGGAAFGSAKLNFTLTASAFSRAETFGTSRLNFTITASAIPSAAAFGMAGISQIGRLAPSGISSTLSLGIPALIYNQVLIPGSITTSTVYGVPRLCLYLIPIPPSSSAIVGVPVLKPQQFLSPSGITTTAAAGELWLDLHITATAIVRTAVFGTAIVINRQLISPSGFARTTAFGASLLSQGHLLLTGIASAAAFGSPSVIRFVFHVIITAVYSVDAPVINRIYIIGQSAAGVEVSGTAITQSNVDLVGERLEVRHDTAIPSAAAASAVAAALLVAARLDSKRGAMTIPPHCGLELWDVLSVYDEIANQNTTYRVSGYTFDYDTRQGTYLHTLALCAP